MRNLVALSLAVFLTTPACSEEPVELSPGNSASPNSASVETIANAAATPDLRRQSAEWLQAEYPDTKNLLLRQGLADLDGDGTEEVFAYVGGVGMCGSGGCPLVVLRQSDGGFDKVLETSVTQLPLGILETTTNGMRDIWVTTYGGGAPEAIRRLTFDGESYPSNPTGADIETIERPGTVIITAGELAPIPN